VKWGETGREMAAEFCPLVSLSYLKEFLTCCKISMKKFSAELTTTVTTAMFSLFNYFAERHF
jgi:hypothetical protein